MAHPVRCRAEVLGCAAEGAYHRLVLRAPDAASRVRPGHFASVAGDHAVVRDAVAIARADAAAGTLELLVADGPRSGPLDLIAPLGAPFPVPDGPVRALLVGHAHHAAPLPALGEQLKARGGQLGYLLGAPTAAALHGVDEARALTQDVLVVTEDGSAGLTGRVCDPVAQAARAIDASVVYAAGPPDVLAVTAAAAADLGIRCWTMLATDLPCGTGLCAACVVPVVGADGVSRFARVCTEGPVFDGGRIRWADIGAVPADLEGA
ncbi:dihydroorotate dehydrogenase electron transfer subunit [Streptomyces sp. TLI_235]|nr:dihydroorotate dehydrogenase electron transfer subunit [Streptomyces sp. TLI_235]PBC76305.1 dihydroorotate dehydrogenase electron transfer subunit [Streptomyces sp. TLI_235]